MKYIKKLNINFDQWNELKLNKCTYLIFNNGYVIYFGYIKNNYCYLLNSPHKISLKAINNIDTKLTLHKLIYCGSFSIKYKELKQTDFYKNNNNNILIVGVDVYKEDILKNPELYNNNELCKTKLKL